MSNDFLSSTDAFAVLHGARSLFAIPSNDTEEGPREGRRGEASSTFGTSGPHAALRPEPSSTLGTSGPHAALRPEPSSTFGTSGPHAALRPEPSSTFGTSGPHAALRPEPSSTFGTPGPHAALRPAPSSSRGAARELHRSKGFVLQIVDEGEPLVCADVRGFREAALAALDPRVPAPSRLVLVAPEGDACAWLEGWAEDESCVRRTITVSRRFDGKEITAVATLSSYGFGVETSLAVESICASRGRGERSVILRSGVHAKADVEAALARYDAELRAREEAEARAASPIAEDAVVIDLHGRDA